MKTQTRGNCQCCGHDQAIVRGRMAQHGYTVEHGYFNGVCYGHQHAPLQLRRDTADKIIADVRAQVVALLERVEALKAGTVKPETCKGKWAPNLISAGRGGYETLPFEQGDDYQQSQAIAWEISAANRRASAGKDFADYLESMANTYHGQELRIVEKREPVARIQAGEKRKTQGGIILTARYQDGRRVFWTREDGRKSWTGTQSWRTMELVNGETLAK